MDDKLRKEGRRRFEFTLNKIFYVRNVRMYDDDDRKVSGNFPRF